MDSVGFEPTEVINLTGFQDQHLKPLGQLSKFAREDSNLHNWNQNPGSCH